MDIAAISTIMKQGQVQQDAALSVMKLIKGQAASNGEAITKMADDTVRMMQQSVQPHLGANLDILA